MAILDRINTAAAKLWATTKNVFGRVRAIPKAASRATRRLFEAGHLRLYYFEEILPFEFHTINLRRERVASVRSRDSRRGVISPNPPNVSDERVLREGQPVQAGHREGSMDEASPPSPDPKILFAAAATVRHEKRRRPPSAADRARNPNHNKMHPRPVPCDATGLALSGGGIRSAAICLGALQALQNRGRLASIDYMSTVSGGGYIGACLSAAMSSGKKSFPFGADVYDSSAVAHLRNYSNYLLPRGRSGVRNLAEAVVVILRGLIANSVIVLAILLGFALATAAAYADRNTLGAGSMLPRLLDGFLAVFDVEVWKYFGSGPFGLTSRLIMILGPALLAWAVLRQFRSLDRWTGDTSGYILRAARVLLVATFVAAFLDLQPLAIGATIRFHDAPPSQNLWLNLESLKTLAGLLTAFSGVVAVFASTLGRFLDKSEHGRGWGVFFRRALAKSVIVVAGLVLPIILWLAYLWLAAWLIAGWDVPAALDLRALGLLPLPGDPSPVTRLFLVSFGISATIALFLKANAYSLHRFYRDRLSKAFLFETPSSPVDPKPLDDLKLSGLRNSDAPYHIINAAMNVQGSAEANRRGRNADFFTFTTSFVGSDLTLYARTDAGAALTHGDLWRGCVGQYGVEYHSSSVADPRVAQREAGLLASQSARPCAPNPPRTELVSGFAPSAGEILPARRDAEPS
jgi:hypothetical protein